MKKTNNKPDLKIIGFMIRGFRGIQAAEMKLAKKGLIPIVGKNRAGKTTILDFLRWMIKGNKELNPDIINWEKTKMEGKLTLNQYEIERVYSGKSSKLKVKNTTTGEYETGEVQNFIDTFIDELTIDTRNFLDKTPYQMLKFVMDFLGLDFTEQNKKLEQLEQERLLCGQRIKRYGDLDTDAPEKVERIDVGNLIAEKQKIKAENATILEGYEIKKEKELAEIEVFNKDQRNKAKQIEIEEDRLSDLRKDEIYYKDEIQKLKDLLKEKKNELSLVNNNIIDSLESLTKLSRPESEKPLTVTIEKPKLKSIDELDERIGEVGIVNEKAQQYENHLAKKKEKAEEEKQYSDYDTRVNSIREEKLRILREIDTKVKGLEIKENGLYYNGVYSENWSDMESIRIVSELCIAQEKSKIRAIFVDRFESFDKESRDSFAKWCEASDVQALVTVVRDEQPTNDELGNYFWIEAGNVEYHSGNNGESVGVVEEEKA